jgi:hypothetical protein
MSIMRPPVFLGAGYWGAFVVRVRRRIQALAVAAIATTQVIVAPVGPTGAGAAEKAWFGYPDGITLLASQVALIMNGTFEPVVTADWVSQVMQEFIHPVIGSGYDGTALDTPEQFWPVTGLFSLTFNDSVRVGHDLLHSQVSLNLQQDSAAPSAVFGYSQSAIIASVQKRTLATEYADSTDVPPVAFVMAGNPFRPNGGFLARFPNLARLLTPWTELTATPTDTGFATYDIARQYEMWADFPTYPLNLLADINALFGLMNHWYLPDSINPPVRTLIPTVSLDPASPDYIPGTVVERYGDTTYYTVKSEHLPMLYPLRWIGLGPLTDIVEPVLRVLVELGYDRTAPAGEIVRAGLFPNINLATLASDLGAAVAEGEVALRKLFTVPEAARIEARSVSSATVRRGNVTAKPVRPASTTIPAPVAAEPQLRREPTQFRQRSRGAASDSPSSKMATARVHPADAA